MLTTQAVSVPAGPGSVQVHVNAVLPTSEHSTHVYAYGRDTAQPRDIVVDRLMRWGSGTEGHRSPGSSTASSVWEFAEGGHGVFTTYVAVFNPNPVATTVRVYYRHARIEGSGGLKSTVKVMGRVGGGRGAPLPLAPAVSSDISANLPINSLKTCPICAWYVRVPELEFGPMITPFAFADLYAVWWLIQWVERRFPVRPPQ